MDFQELKTRLLSLDTACVCDANKSLRATDPTIDALRVAAPAIRPVRTGLKLVGRAHTVRCHNDFLAVIRGLRDAVADDVLVVDSQGSDRAVSGSLFPTEAIRKGLAGIVVDGPCRDTRTIRELDLPYYARSHTPYAGTTSNPGQTQIPITCGGVTVNPGDILFGDDDGLVIATSEELAAVLPIAETIQHTESVMIGKMTDGTCFLDMLNFESHLAALEAGEPSSLQFTV
ncbi:MAG TPA: dimethylmenaquinone methyltransferase [Planctomycetaceae bacterium]|nr:dimethylmenaquinone methyltransferase [Planctomycetaceae bacterium]